MDRYQFIRAAAEGSVERVRRLLEKGVDVNTRDIDGRTALHEACMGGYDKVVELLIENGACLNMTSNDGNTVLHKACLGGHLKIVELLIKKGADLNVTDKFGHKALHDACRGGHDKVVELLIKNRADLNVADIGGVTALHEACGGGHDKVAELLIRNGADVNVNDNDENTALHKACRRGHEKVVELLIKSGACLNVINVIGDTGLHDACRGGHDKVVELLIKNRADLRVIIKDCKSPNLTEYVAGLGKGTQLLLKTETRKHAEYNELIYSTGSKKGTTVKLFLCGDGQVGKTSLEAILEKTGFLERIVWNVRSWYKMHTGDVFNPTPGVNVSRKDVLGIGRLSVHDFAGQAQFYVTHAMLLRTTNAIFPVVYKITDGEDEQKRQIHGWLSFIHCSNADPTNKPRIVLIASHADKLQDQEAGLHRATALVEHYRKLFQEALIVSQEVFLINCLKAGSSEIQRLREVLSEFRDDLLEQRPEVPKVCVRLLGEIECWRKERKTFPVMGWQDYLASMEHATYGTVKERIVQLATSYLHDEGEIIYLRHETDSLVVLDLQWLFTSVFGSLLAPDNFGKIIDKINRTAEDHVTLEELTSVFSAAADIPLLIKLLQDFQLCHTYDGRTFILPSLLQQEMEKTAWSPVSSNAIYFGLQIRCRTEIDSFSCDLFPRLQTLLMQAHPGKLSRPLLWKDSAKCTDGEAGALLQITQDKRQLNIFVRSTRGIREHCTSLMDLLKDMTYRLLHETSPGARSRDMVLSTLDLLEHRPNPHAYSREEVEAAAAKGENLVHPQRNVPERVKDLLLHLGSLKGMLGRVAQKRPELVETLRHINPILDHLRADDVINLDENDRIRAARTPQDAARELLDILEAKGERACVKFHSVLKTCDKYAASLLVEEQMSEEGAAAN
ncbi:death-associated protein kinase 1-like [Branchiostoma floridae]|uniref:Death-associated protein kinase 1-like n=1 Tax=Branchiostoma floridae TaxID=7739 RepID=A0A9J7KPB8_BRAFL|nr:death-associated protein kinase 1-like [Branchiostoma floridae]XP_035667627.1 death-associated protein kinase 1-like [Branchiostoma floridae]